MWIVANYRDTVLYCMKLPILLAKFQHFFYTNPHLKIRAADLFTSWLLKCHLLIIVTESESECLSKAFGIWEKN